VGADLLDLLATRILALRADLGRPVLVGLDGAVAVGKSTLAGHLTERLRAAGAPTAVVGADGFLWPTAQIQARGLTKGFPESYDREAMVAFLDAVRAGDQPAAPRYDHATYDVAAEPGQATAGSAVVIFEGVNTLGADLARHYDLRVYLDAAPADIVSWYLRRFAATPFSPVRVVALAPWRPANGDVQAWGKAVWDAVNGPNLARYIVSGRTRADVVLHKAADHTLSVVD